MPTGSMMIKRTTSALVWKPTQIRELDLREAIAIIEDLRPLVPALMRNLMYQGYPGLILADRIHKIDDRMREYLGRVLEQ
jgi:hypothetical protein